MFAVHPKGILRSMAIEDLTNEQLKTLEENYVRANKTEGGKYSLYEVRVERRRRSPSPFETRQVAQKIIEMARNAPDGLVTYGAIWKAFRPNEKWVGHNPRSIMSNTLGRVISYCVRNRLPILTVLVVQASTKRLSPEAIKNICEECQSLGVDIGPDRQTFVDQQAAAARALIAAALPEDPLA